MKTRSYFAGMFVVACILLAGVLLLTGHQAEGVAFVLANAPVVVPATEEGLKELAKAFKATTDEIKQIAEKVAGEMKAHGDATKETKDKADELLVKQTELSSRIKEIEQKLERRPGPGEAKEKSAGYKVIESDEYKSMAEGKVGKVRISVKDITSGASSAADLVVEQRVPGIIMPQLRRLTVRDLLAPGRTNSNTIEYVKELLFTNAAAPVAEGSEKPQSELTFEDATSTVRTIAHWVRASKQILADAPMLQSYIDERMRHGLKLEEEDQLLNGDGTGQNLLGLIPQATAFADQLITGIPHRNRIDILRVALLQVVLAEFEADAIVLHPTDWARIELTKDTTGQYVWANPASMLGPVLWGKPVVPTQSMTEANFLTGAFRMGAQIFDREDATVELSTEDGDNFRTNKVTIRCEERLALAVYRPASFVAGDFSETSN